MGFDAVRWLWHYFLLGAVIVVPIWLLVRLAKSAAAVRLAPVDAVGALSERPRTRMARACSTEKKARLSRPPALAGLMRRVVLAGNRH